MTFARRAVATAAAGLCLAAIATVGSTTTASADSTNTIGTFRTSTYVPAHVRAGSTITLHSWFVWHAYHRTSHELVAQDSDFSLWNTRSGSCRGASVSFFNPLTHKWQAGRYTGSCNYSIGLGALPGIWAFRSGERGHLDIRITFSKHTPTGAWKIEPEPSNGYGIINRAEQGQNEELAFPAWPIYTTRLTR